ncbi:MAG: hypothetical protein SGBAC_008192 [Bacillariaceae sp.]
MMYNGNESPIAALTEELGGELQFSSFVMTFSESVLKDLELQVAFRGMDTEEHAEHMTNLIKMVFGYSDSSMIKSETHGQIFLRNYAIFELGLSRPQLRKLQLYFALSMKDSMVERDVLEICNARFADLCRILESDSKGFRQTKDSMSNDPAMIMMAMASSTRKKLVAPKAA